MFNNYLITALRHILRHRLYSMINIIGLAVGMAACLFIFLFVRYESSYDNWMTDAENIYRVNYTNYYKNGEDYVSASVPGITKAIFDQSFPQIEQSTRFYNFNAIMTLHNDTYKESVWVADRNIFDVLDIKFIEGQRDTVFDDLTTIVLSQKMALKYFGEQSPMGEVFTHTLILPGIDGEDNPLTRDYKVTGVFEDIPENSEFNFDFIFSAYCENSAWQMRPMAPLDVAIQSKSSGVPLKFAGTQMAPTRKHANMLSNIWLQLADCTNIRSPFTTP